MIVFNIEGRLPGCNEYIEECRKNPHAGAKCKADAESMIMWQLGTVPKIEGEVIFRFEWHEKTKRRDKDNVAFAKKFIFDALQKAGKLENDGNRNVAGFEDRFIYGASEGVKVYVYAADEKADGQKDR